MFLAVALIRGGTGWGTAESSVCWSPSWGSGTSLTSCPSASRSLPHQELWALLLFPIETCHVVLGMYLVGCVCAAAPPEHISGGLWVQSKLQVKPSKPFLLLYDCRVLDTQLGVM